MNTQKTSLSEFPSLHPGTNCSDCRCGKFGLWRRRFHTEIQIIGLIVRGPGLCFSRGISSGNGNLALPACYQNIAKHRRRLLSTTKPFLGVSLLNDTEDLPERHDNDVSCSVFASWIKRTVILKNYSDTLLQVPTVPGKRMLSSSSPQQNTESFLKWFHFHFLKR